MRVIAISVFLLIIISGCENNISKDDNDSDTELSSEINNSNYKESNNITKDVSVKKEVDKVVKINDAVFGKGVFQKNHLNKFDSEEILLNKFKVENKVDSVFWLNLVKPNYEKFNSPALNSIFMYSNQNDLYDLNIFTYKIFERPDEPYVYLVITNNDNKLITRKLIGSVFNRLVLLN